MKHKHTNNRHIPNSTRTPYTHAKWASERASEREWKMCEKKGDFQWTKGNCLLHSNTSIEHWLIVYVCVWERGCYVQLWPLPLDMWHRLWAKSTFGRQKCWAVSFRSAKTLDKEWQHEYKKHERINNRTERTSEQINETNISRWWWWCVYWWCTSRRV